MEGLRKLGSQPSWLRRILIPLLYAAVLVFLSAAISGSYLIEIEDHYANAIFGGAYGNYDPYAPAIHPYFGRLITGLYGLVPQINWFGVTLLALLLLSAAAAISLAGRRPGGLIPGIVILTPILVVLTCSLQSQVVAGLCVVSGALCTLDGCRDGGRGIRRVLFGAALCALGVALSMEMAWLLAGAVLLCSALAPWRGKRWRALGVCAVIVACSLGLPTLLARTDAAWWTFHEQYMAYDQAQQTYLREEVNELLGQYGMVFSVDGDLHSEEDVNLDEAALQDAVSRTGFAQALDWTLNDAGLFIRRTGVDTQLVSPENVKALNQTMRRFSLEGLLDKLLVTLKKLQFLMLLALFLFTALALQLSNRRKGLPALGAAVVALGGHVVMLTVNRTSFCDIAPLYLAGILVLLDNLDVEASLRWLEHTIRPLVLRKALAIAAAVCFIVGLGGLGYMMRRYNLDKSPSVAAAQELYDAMEKLPYAVFIGDNPLDRYNPSALTVPTLGSDERLLAGSYDLYSPRAARQMERFGLTNPLLDAVDRPDVIYVDMSGSTLVVAINRLFEAYDTIALADIPIAPDGSALLDEASQHRMQLYTLVSLTEQELDALQAEIQESAEDHDHDEPESADGTNEEAP